MGQHRLFGRDQEMAQWRLLADSVAAGRNAGLTISGPSGIGKTALIEQLCREARDRGWKLLRAAGDESRQLPGAMLWQWFAPLAQRHAAGAPPFDGQGALLHRFLTATELEASQDALSYSASWVLRSLSQQQPVAAVVDDAQWLDELSLAVLLDVGSLLLDVPVLLLRGLRTNADGQPDRRPGEAPAGDARRILPPRDLSSGAELHWRLQPLSREAIESWLVARRQDTLAANAARLQAASGGVPFFIRELLEREQAGRSLAPTISEDAVLRERLDRLPELERQVLGAYQMAVQLGERGLEEDGLPPELHRQLLVEAAHAHEMAGRHQRAEELARQALAMTRGSGARARLLLEFAETLYNNGRVEPSTECYAQALKELDNEPGGDGELRRQVVALAAGAGFQQMQFAKEYAAVLGQVLGQDPAEDGPSDRLLLVQEALRLTLAGEDARRSGELAVRAVAGGKLLAENGAASNIINYATGALNGAEEDAVALALLDAAIVQARADSAVMAHATLAYCRGALQFRRGRLRLAQVDLESCLRAADQGWRTYLETACVVMAGILIARDDLEPLDGLLARVPLGARRLPLVQAMALQLHGMVAAATAPRWSISPPPWTWPRGWARPWTGGPPRRSNPPCGPAPRRTWSTRGWWPRRR
ncbi:AAA family ATPase, partial [Arthrobacter sp. GCM10027362]|uniref:ATP-binding protein n=1 Tax=Arthrobacter sp. GCM10027362 TaxID=3273379 RepID=UPI00363F49FB